MPISSGFTAVRRQNLPDWIEALRPSVKFDDVGGKSSRSTSKTKSKNSARNKSIDRRPTSVILPEEKRAKTFVLPKLVDKNRKTPTKPKILPRSELSMIEYRKPVRFESNAFPKLSTARPAEDSKHISVSFLPDLNTNSERRTSPPAIVIRQRQTNRFPLIQKFPLSCRNDFPPNPVFVPVFYPQLTPTIVNQSSSTASIQTTNQTSHVEKQNDRDDLTIRLNFNDQSERTRRKKYIDFESEKIIYVDRDPEERRFVRHSPIHSDVDYVLVEEIPREIVRRRRAPQKVIYVEEDEDEEDDLVYVDQHGNEVELFHKRSPILYRRIR